MASDPTVDRAHQSGCHTGLSLQVASIYSVASQQFTMSYLIRCLYLFRQPAVWDVARCLIATTFGPFIRTISSAPASLLDFLGILY